MTQETQQPAAVKKVLVRATKPGFFNGSRRRVGDTFYAPSDHVSDWFEPTDPTLAAINRAAIEDAAKAKLAAQEKARQAAGQIEQEAKAKKQALAADLKNATVVADEIARQTVLGTQPGDPTLVTAPPAPAPTTPPAPPTAPPPVTPAPDVVDFA